MDGEVTGFSERKKLFERLEPCEGKLSCTVLRGGGFGNKVPLPDSMLTHSVWSRSSPITDRDGGDFHKTTFR
ncbi:MAG: hypothetical protein FJ135_05135 [Deltaproteobacteria bacterium]|nr:hypothetical protein [Deltaproteobacteria bacterium]